MEVIRNLKTENWVHNQISNPVKLSKVIGGLKGLIKWRGRKKSDMQIKREPWNTVWVKKDKRKRRKHFMLWHDKAPAVSVLVYALGMNKQLTVKLANTVSTKGKYEPNVQSRQFCSFGHIFLTNSLYFWECNLMLTGSESACLNYLLTVWM